MTFDLEASYQACRHLARSQAKNFYYAFLTLPTAKRRGMCALYAFLRRTDDIGDEPAPLPDRRARLAAWRVSLDRALGGKFDDPLLPAVADTVRRFRIPADLLRDTIDGVAMDLAGYHYETFDELEGYCYRVAGAVGLACLAIWGFHDDRALEPARQLGTAFQLTNILRDLGEDADNGRVYLPAEDLRRWGYTADQLRQKTVNPAFHDLMTFQIARAHQLYQQGVAVAEWLDKDGLPSLAVMVKIYHGLLRAIEQRPADVFRRRVRLSRFTKARMLAGCLLLRPTARSIQQSVAVR